MEVLQCKDAALSVMAKNGWHAIILFRGRDLITNAIWIARPRNSWSGNSIPSRNFALTRDSEVCHLDSRTTSGFRAAMRKFKVLRTSR